MGLIAWIVLGGLAGFLGNYIMRGGFGLMVSLILGIVAAVIAGWVSNAVRGSTDAFQLDFVSIVMSTFFAIIVVGIAKFALGRGSEA
jgi:uncharacterized membrane protein YeaQ/YmgE (transglycosylase-associated protein family)